MAFRAAVGEPCTGPAELGGCGVNGCPGIPGVCPGAPWACPGKPPWPGPGAIGTNCPLESIWNPGGAPGIPPGSPPGPGCPGTGTTAPCGLRTWPGACPGI